MFCVCTNSEIIQWELCFSAELFLFVIMQYGKIFNYYGITEECISRSRYGDFQIKPRPLSKSQCTFKNCQISGGPCFSRIAAHQISFVFSSCMEFLTRISLFFVFSESSRFKKLFHNHLYETLRVSAIWFTLFISRQCGLLKLKWMLNFFKNRVKPPSRPDHPL